MWHDIRINTWPKLADRMFTKAELAGTSAPVVSPAHAGPRLIAEFLLVDQQ